MINLNNLYKSKKISHSEWIAAKYYITLKKSYLRSTALKNNTYQSSLQKLHQTKGLNHDLFELPQLENFWKGLHHYAAYDDFPFLKIIDIITGFSNDRTYIPDTFIKKALQKLKSVLKAVDIFDLLEQIEKLKNLG